MKSEIEVKFLNINHDDIRAKLRGIGGECERPMRVMRRAIIDYPDSRLQKADDVWGFVRVRDEGNKTVLTFKQFPKEDATVDNAREIETVVDDFEATIKIFEAIGLKCFSMQETKRETWKIGNVEVVLDEWPWLKPYIEIEGESEQGLRDVASKLGLEWGDAVFGSTMTAYQAEYPHLTDNDTVGTLDSVKFGDPLPELLKP